MRTYEDGAVLISSEPNKHSSSILMYLVYYNDLFLEMPHIYHNINHMDLKQTDTELHH